jgi:threonine aldolase
MFFASDNAGPALPQVMQKLLEANTGYQAPYGDDTIMEEVRETLRELFEAPEAAIYLVATGTAANSLALATYTNPWDTIFCSPVAHINVDECNAPEFYANGAKLTLVPGTDRMTPQALRATIAKAQTHGVHGAQRGPVSITQVAELGGVYTLGELEALCDVAKEFDLPVHLDGARFANALVALDCTPAEMTWKAGVDVVSFGGTKNGCMGVEAVIFFDPTKAWEFELRRKRGAHLFSKHRYLSAQMAGYLENEAWLDAARKANANCVRLHAGLEAQGANILHAVEANIIFATLPRATHQKLQSGGAVYNVMDGDVSTGNPDQLLTARFVCDWSLTNDQIDQFLALF